MGTQDSTKSNNDQTVEFSEHIARIETKIDFVATHKDVAAVRAEIEGTRTEIASLKGELLNQMSQMDTAMVAEVAGIRTLVANREASMQRWLLGIAATTVVGVSSALAGVTAALIRAFA